MTPHRAALVALAGCAAACGGRADPGGPFHREPDLSRMVAIAAGTFSMGHPVEPPGPYGQAWKENELPAHDVTLSAYWIDRDEVAVAEYAEFLSEAGGEDHRHPLQPIARDGARYEPLPGAGARPIALVSWYDAAVYCAWAGKRLPTEAEWERAARGSFGATYPWGEDAPTCERAVFFTGATLCEAATAPVGSRSPAGDSAEGVHDLAGNVAEWVADGYGRYGADPLVDPRGPVAAPTRAIRGGGFHETGASLRGSARWDDAPSDRSVGLGFRCAR